MISKLLSKLAGMKAAWKAHTAFPDGHPCSPVVSPAYLRARTSSLWPAPGAAGGLMLDPDAHCEFVAMVLARHSPLFDYPDRADHGYYSDNPYFSWLDSRVLVAMMMHFKPARVVEVGSGFSSLLMADVNVRRFDRRVELTCIDPRPRTDIENTSGIARIVYEEVQSLDHETFTQLRDGDFLFIDSSHVAKTGSDVNFLILDVLPTLAPGVVVHVHDIFIPFEYPISWVLEQNRSWNEQYVLQAFLSMNSAYSVLFGSAFAGAVCGKELESVFGVGAAPTKGGSSFWIRRAGGRRFDQR